MNERAVPRNRPRRSLQWTLLLTFICSGAVPAADCNGNGILDVLDVVPGLDFAAAEALIENRRLDHVTAVDIDSDGDGDFVLGGLTLSLLRNDGASGFADPVTVLQKPSHAHAVADLDGDGTLDIAALVGSDVAVMLGTGNGDFGPARIVAVGGHLSDPVPADVDGDGHTDLVLGSDQRVIVLRGDGRGSFDAAIEYGIASPVAVHESLRVTSVAMADLEEDGILDLIAAIEITDGGASQSGWVIIRAGVPGGFAEPEPVPVGLNPAHITVADLDADQAPDIVVANSGVAEEGGDVSVLWGDGAGGIEASVELKVGAQPVTVEVFDMDGDGDLDLVTADSGSSVDRATISVLLHLDGRSFAPAARYHQGAGVGHAAIVDHDLDGHPDVVAASISQPAGLYLLRNAGDGSLRAPRNYAEEESGVSDVEVIDFDGDGHLDLLTATITPRVWVGAVSLLRGDGFGRFTDSQRISAEIGRGIDFCCNHFSSLVLTAGDFDSDELVDVVVGERREEDLTGAITVLLGDGRRLIGGQRLSTRDGVTAIASGDLDGDGDLDIVVSNTDFERGSANVHVLTNDSQARFELVRDVALSSRPEALRVRDVDGDGRVDIVVGVSDFVDSPDGIVVLFNEGALEFSSPLRLATRPDRSIALGDVDGDGRTDLVSGGDIQLQTRGRHFQEFRIGEVLFATHSAAGDFTGDGNVDFAAASVLSTHLRLVANTGDLFFESPVAFLAGQTVMALETADLDGDGADDLIMANAGFEDFVGVIDGIFERKAYADGSIDVLLSRPRPPFSADEDDDGVPDECESTPDVSFRRGDCNDDSSVNISDVLCILNWLFRGGATPRCVAVTNTNGDASEGIADAMYLLNHLFAGGSAPVAPYVDCGPGTLPTDETTCATAPLGCRR